MPTSHSGLPGPMRTLLPDAHQLPGGKKKTRQQRAHTNQTNKTKLTNRTRIWELANYQPQSNSIIKKKH